MNDKRPTIEFAPQDQIDLYPKGEREFLNIVGIDSAFITDESTVWDFDAEDAALERLSIRCGFAVTGNSYVWEVAKALQENAQ